MSKQQLASIAKLEEKLFLVTKRKRNLRPTLPRNLLRLESLKVFIYKCIDLFYYSCYSVDDIPKDLLMEAKQKGYADRQVAQGLGSHPHQPPPEALRDDLGGPAPAGRASVRRP